MVLTVQMFTLAILASILLGALAVKILQMLSSDKRIDEQEKEVIKQTVFKQLAVLLSGVKIIDQPKEQFMATMVPMYVELLYDEVPDLTKYGFDRTLVASLIRPVIERAYDEIVKTQVKRE